ncbi:MAG: ATP-binding protein [Candidatus Latescibacterota bacterium]
MTLRRKLLGYLVAVHVLFGVALALVWRQPGPWVLAAEGAFLVSLAVGAQLVRRLWVPLDLIGTGADLIAERDFTSKFREVGQPEMDRLVRVYNRMIDQLREERTRAWEQHCFMERILATAPAGVVTLDFDGRIALANPAAQRLLEAPEAQLEGRTLAQVPGPLARAMDGVPVGGSQTVRLHGQRCIRCQRGTFLDQGFARDYLLLEELTLEVRESERAAYGKVIRLLSHEVNNSVGAVNSLLDSCRRYAEQLQEEDREDFGAALRVAVARNEDLNAFMRGFAEVIRLPPPDLRPVDVRALLGDIERLMEPECRARQIRWVWCEEARLGPVLMDKNQLEQVFLNLLKNAVEAIGSEGEIRVRLSHAQGRPRVVVEDTGPGIPEEVQARLFTPFFSTKERGQGIGLTMAREILDRHGFALAVASEPGKGARFTVVMG